MSWQYDMPSGTFKNHALSQNIRKRAIAKAITMRFLRPENGYGRHKGESVTITRIMNLPNATRISELDRLPSGRPAITTKQVSVSQWGYKVPVTEFEKNLTFFNIMDPIQQALRDQIALTMDVMAADALKKTPIKYVPTSTGATMTTNGTPGAVADRNLGIQDLRTIHDELMGDLLVPKFQNNKYVGILSTRAARGIKNDPEYKDWLAPSTSQPIRDGQLVDVEGFALFESNHVAAWDNSAGTSTVLGEAIFFGADAGGLVRIMDPEIRAGEPQELGTFREVGWVGAIEAFLVWEDPDMARAIHVTSN